MDIKQREKISDSSVKFPEREILGHIAVFLLKNVPFGKDCFLLVIFVAFCRFINSWM
jgi:hypothetical protein